MGVHKIGAKSVRLSADLSAWLVAVSRETGLSQNDLIARSVRYLARASQTDRAVLLCSAASLPLDPMGRVG